jgi:hypothetical protein
VGVREFIDWPAVVKSCVTDLIKPTLLFYQKIHPHIKRSTDSLTISSYELYSLEKAARLQTFKMKDLDNQTDIQQQAMILEQIQRQRAKTMASATPKKIASSNIKVIEEIKEVPRTLDTNNSPRDS